MNREWRNIFAFVASLASNHPFWHPPVHTSPPAPKFGWAHVTTRSQTKTRHRIFKCATNCDALSGHPGPFHLQSDGGPRYAHAVAHGVCTRHDPHPLCHFKCAIWCRFLRLLRSPGEGAGRDVCTPRGRSRRLQAGCDPRGKNTLPRLVLFFYSWKTLFFVNFLYHDKSPQKQVPPGLAAGRDVCTHQTHPPGQREKPQPPTAGMCDEAVGDVFYQ